MSEETNGNGNGKGSLPGLRGLLSQNEVEIKLLLPNGEESGVVFYFDPLDAQTDRAWSHILQRGQRQRKPNDDEANLYMFKQKFLRAEGISEGDLAYAKCPENEVELFKSDQKAMLLKSKAMWPIVRRSIVAYMNEVMPDAEGSKS